MMVKTQDTLATSVDLPSLQLLRLLVGRSSRLKGKLSGIACGADVALGSIEDILCGLDLVEHSVRNTA